MTPGKLSGTILFNTTYRPAKIYQGDEFYVYYHYRNPETGKMQMFKERAGLNRIKKISERKEAAKSLQRIIDERLKNGWSPFGNGTEKDLTQYEPLVELLPKLLEAKKSQLRQTSYNAIGPAVNRFVQWLKDTNRGYMQPAMFTSKDVRAYCDYVLASGLNNKSYNVVVCYVRTFFLEMIDREIITVNPFLKFKTLPTNSGKHYPYNGNQKEELKKYMMKHDPDMWRFCKFLYHFLMRRTETLRVQVRDFNFNTNTLVIHSGHSKNRRQLAVEIPDSFLPELKEWWNWDELPPDWYLFSINLKPGPKQWSANSVSIRYGAILKELKYGEAYTLYGWKHSGNVDAHLAGIDIYNASRQNRHSSIKQTAEYWRALGLRPNTEFRKKAPAL